MKLSIVALATVLLALAQTLPSFDVASVKSDKSGTGVDRIKIQGGSAIIENVSLKRLIAMAYGIPESREYLLAGPEWIGSENFDISAKYPADAPEETTMQMLQRLLAERFHLATHREPRQVSGYTLVVSKAGPKVKSSARQVPMFSVRNGHAAGTGVSMPEFADRLSRSAFQLDRPVVDATGLEGRFDVTFDWTSTDLQPDNPNGGSIFTALEEQLGLRLEPRKLTMDVLVIDHADRTPTAN